jgi:hypothetical protein
MRKKPQWPGKAIIQSKRAYQVYFSARGRAFLFAQRNEQTEDYGGMNLL